MTILWICVPCNYEFDTVQTLSNFPDKTDGNINECRIWILYDEKRSHLEICTVHLKTFAFRSGLGMMLHAWTYVARRARRKHAGWSKVQTSSMDFNQNRRENLAIWFQSPQCITLLSDTCWVLGQNARVISTIIWNGYWNTFPSSTLYVHVSRNFLHILEAKQYVGTDSSRSENPFLF